ncbi:hypothetical protein ACFQPG_11475 [Sphingomonas sp. GCM10030256]|uniref:hypothetical protein n=1 Tax=Sphingomonas sp. GCM10030256 TaxID=3273427 RepID=UPI00360954F8
MPRLTDPKQLKLFLLQLSLTGNLSLSAQRAGLAVSGIHKRRARDPAFADDGNCAAARFRSSSSRPGGQAAGKAFLTTA